MNTRGLIQIPDKGYFKRKKEELEMKKTEKQTPFYCPIHKKYFKTNLELTVHLYEEKEELNV